VSSVDAVAKSLQEKLNSVGRVTWTATTRDNATQAVTGPAQFWSELSQISINPRTCEMRAAWKTSWAGDVSRAYFLDEVDKVEALTTEEHMNRSHPGTQSTVGPTPYSVALTGTQGTSDFKVPDQQTADQVAQSLRQVVEACKVIPPPAANSGPSLEATLNFIADKLNGQGVVSWLSTAQNTVAGTTGPPTQVTLQISNAIGDPRTCRLTYHAKITAAGKVSFDGDALLPLRRVEKLAVMTMQDANNEFHARQGHPELTETISPAIYRLLVTSAANRETFFLFIDQDLANRVAKAMNHTAELCGAGGSQEPF
jgi:hypothetical protein